MIGRLEFENIIRTHGHNVYLQRRQNVSESGPYREVAGGRYAATAEKWTSWRYFPGTAASKTNGPSMAAMGIIDGSGVIFFLQAECLPKKGDLISEETPHERTDRNTYRVEVAIPYYDGNTVVFFAAHCKILDPIS